MEALERKKRTGAVANPVIALATLYVATVAVYSDMYITQPILPLISREFAVAPATAGLTVSAVVLTIALASSSSGPLSDTLGRKPVMVGSCALLAVPTLLCALAPGFELLMLFRALQGLCIPGLTAVAVAYIGDCFPPARLGALVGGWISATVAGGLTGRVISGLITDLLSWRAAFVFFAIVTLLCALAMWLLLPDAPMRAAPGWISAYRGMLSHLGDRRLVGAFLIGGALFFGFIGVFTYLPYYLTSAPFLLSPAVVSLLYLVYLAGVIVSPLAGRLSRHIPRRTIIACGLLIAMLGVAGTVMPSILLIIASLLVLCTGMFTAQAVAPAFVNATARQNKGGAGSLYLMFYYVGGTLGAVLPGFAWQAFGWGGVVSVCLLALLLALLADWLLCAE